MRISNNFIKGVRNINLLRTLWTFLNGKKTLIGTLIFFFAVEFQQAGLVNMDLLHQIDMDVTILGTLVTALGITHKMIKFLDKPETPATPVA